MTIDQIQDEIIDEFADLNGDLEIVLFHIVRQARRLMAMPCELRTDDNLIKGCHSNVWLASTTSDGHVYFNADSDTMITRGLASLLLRVFDGQLPAEIVAADLYFIRRCQLERFIGTKRSNGFSSMIEHVKRCVTR